MIEWFLAIFPNNNGDHDERPMIADFPRGTGRHHHPRVCDDNDDDDDVGIASTSPPIQYYYGTTTTDGRGGRRSSSSIIVDESDSPPKMMFMPASPSNNTSMQNHHRASESSSSSSYHPATSASTTTIMDASESIYRFLLLPHQAFLILFLEFLNSFRSFGLRFVLYNYITNEFGISDGRAGVLLGVKGFVDIGEH